MVAGRCAAHGPSALAGWPARRRSFSWGTRSGGVLSPTVYACSFSFTKFLVGKVGLGEVVALAPLMASGGVPKRIEQLTHTTVARLREEWLRKIT